MNIAFLPDLFALVVLVSVLALLQRQHPDRRGKVWLAGLVVTLLEALAHTFYSQDGIPAKALHVIVLDCYLVSGLIFLWAASECDLGDRPRLLELTMHASPLLAISTMYGMHLQRVAPYIGAAIVGALCAVCSLAVFRRSQTQVSLLILGWIAVGVLAAAGEFRQAVYWSMCALYSLSALMLRERLPRRSLGKLTMMTGFIVWALCLLIHPWVVHYREYADVASHVWNMQKGLISIGLLLLLLERQVAENRWLAQHDELTGLPNRRSFERTFAEALAEARRSKSGVALVLLDLNGFKAVNDSLGHQAGDLLLSGVAKNLGRLASETSVAARLGGDEFVVSALLSRAHETVFDVLADVRVAMEQPVCCGDREMVVKASVGFAVFPEDATQAHDLLKLADQRMYVLKGKHAASERSVGLGGERWKLAMPEPWLRPSRGQSTGSSRGNRI